MKNLILLLAFAIAPVFAGNSYPVEAPYVVDGDTIRGDVVLWASPAIKVSPLIRLAGVDTPELRGNGQRVIPPCEKSLAKAAMEFADRWITDHMPVSISDVKRDKYGDRIEAQVRGADGSLLAGALLAAGHARLYSGGARQAWCG